MAHTDLTLREFAGLIRFRSVASPDQWADGPLKVGVDLGTANLVLAVLDAQNRPWPGSPIARAWCATASLSITWARCTRCAT